jgi:hypothetical protein
MDNKEIVCFYFFKDTTSTKATAADAISAILHQLFTQWNELLGLALTAWSDEGEKLSKNLSSLWSILKNCAETCRAPITCILDGLDEASDDQRDELINQINSYFRDTHGHGSLKMLVSGRPYLNTKYRFQALTSGVPYNAYFAFENQPLGFGWDTILHHETNQLPLSEEVKQHLQKELLKIQTTSRTFLWLKLMFDQLKYNLSLEGAAKEKINEFLSQPPNSLYDAYEKLLSRSQDQRAARRLLCIVLGASEPLSLAEMKTALAVANGDKDLPEEELDFSARNSFLKMISALCGLFITVVDSKIYLLHQTAKEFLLGSNDGQISRTGWEKSITPAVPKNFFSCIRLKYLSLERFDREVQWTNPDWFQPNPPFMASAIEEPHTYGPVEILGSYVESDRQILREEQSGVLYEYVRPSSRPALLDLSRHNFWLWFFSAYAKSGYHRGFLEISPQNRLNAVLNFLEDTDIYLTPNLCEALGYVPPNSSNGGPRDDFLTSSRLSGLDPETIALWAASSPEGDGYYFHLSGDDLLLKQYVGKEDIGFFEKVFAGNVKMYRPSQVESIGWTTRSDPVTTDELLDGIDPQPVRRVDLNNETEVSSRRL